MKQRSETVLKSDSLVLALWGVVILCVVTSGAYVVRYQAFLDVPTPLDPNQFKHQDPNDTDLKQLVARDEDRVKAFQSDNLLVKEPPKQNPVNAVNIIGREALINGQLYKVGDKIGDALIVAITPKTVTVEWNGQKTTLSPLNGPTQAAPDRPEPRQETVKTASQSPPTPEPSREAEARQVFFESTNGPVNISPEEIEQIRRKASSNNAIRIIESSSSGGIIITSR